MKKTIALLLVFCMMLTVVLTGCRSGKPSDGTVTGDGTAATDVPGSKPAETEPQPAFVPGEQGSTEDYLGYVVESVKKLAEEAGAIEIPEAVRNIANTKAIRASMDISSLMEQLTGQELAITARLGLTRTDYGAVIEAAAVYYTAELLSAKIYVAGDALYLESPALIGDKIYRLTYEKLGEYVAQMAGGEAGSFQMPSIPDPTEWLNAHKDQIENIAKGYAEALEELVRSNASAVGAKTSVNFNGAEVAVVDVTVEMTAEQVANVMKGMNAKLQADAELKALAEGLLEEYRELIDFAAQQAGAEVPSFDELLTQVNAAVEEGAANAAPVKADFYVSQADGSLVGVKAYEGADTYFEVMVGENVAETGKVAFALTEAGETVESGELTVKFTSDVYAVVFVAAGAQPITVTAEIAPATGDLQVRVETQQYDDWTEQTVDVFYGLSGKVLEEDNGLSIVIDSLTMGEDTLTLGLNVKLLYEVEQPALPSNAEDMTEEDLQNLVEALMAILGGEEDETEITY